MSAFGSFRQISPFNSFELKHDQGALLFLARKTDSITGIFRRCDQSTPAHRILIAYHPYFRSLAFSPESPSPARHVDGNLGDFSLDGNER